MSRELKLTCWHDPQNAVEVFSPVKANTVPGIAISLKLGDKNTDLVALDVQATRELFNWLGVWLHGGHRS